MQTLLKIAFVAGLTFLAFLWGASAVLWKVFPYRQIMHIQTGIEAWQNLEDNEMPQHFLSLLPEATAPDPITRYAPVAADDLILMTEGFYFRQDLCPDFGCMAMVIDRTGRALHTWQFDPAALFKPEDFKDFTGYPSPANLNVQGTDIDPDGNLIVVFQGRNVYPYQVGIAKFSWDGRLLWAKVDRSHHWPAVGPDGRIYVPIARIEKSQTNVAGTSEPLVCKGQALFQEGVQILAPDGTVEKRFWMEDLVKASDMQGLAYSVRSDCDPYHVNGVALLNAAAAARLPGTRVGDLLVSLRSSSALVVLDQTDGHIISVVKGPMVAQHSPNVAPDGSFLAFDNLGGIDTKMGTRVVRIDPQTGHGTTIFPRDKTAPGGDLNSIAQGAVALSADGSRMLVAETMGGRLFEVDLATGKALWKMEAVSDMTPFYATIGEVKDGPTWARMQTQGARYMASADVARWMGL